MLQILKEEDQVQFCNGLIQIQNEIAPVYFYHQKNNVLKKIKLILKTQN